MVTVNARYAFVRAMEDVAQVENPASEAVRREREESVTKFT